MISRLLIVAVGSGVGGVLRYLISVLSRAHPAPFPYWTLSVNVIGGFLIGLFAGVIGSEAERGRLLLITGFCGGFTTFSAFSLETLELFQQGAWGWGAANVLLNTLCALGACWLGYIAGR